MKIHRPKPIPCIGRTPEFDVRYLHAQSRLKFPNERKYRRLLTAFTVSGTIIFAGIAVWMNLK